MTETSTLEGLGSSEASRRRRWGRWTGFTVLMIVIVLGLAGVLGPRAGTVQAQAGGYRLTVEHPAVVRSGQPAPLKITLEGPETLTGPVELALDPDVFELFDFQNWYPNPDSETRSESELRYEFELPDATSLVVQLDARAQPRLGISRQEHWVAVLIDGQEAVRVSYDLWVAP